MAQNVLMEMLVEDLGSVFLKRFQSRMVTVWNEAISRSIKDDNIHESVKPYCFGHDKYFLTQSMFLKLGADCGYESKIVPCEQNNYPIPVVIANRFRFTVHHAFKPNEKYAPNPSQTRLQDSRINNGYLKRAQRSLFDDPVFDESKVAGATGIQANLLFGCDGNGLDFLNHGFLRIAIPSTEPETVNGKETGKVLLVENYAFNDVLGLVSEKERANKAQPVIEIAVPKIKTAKQ
jgi:hypothetical protein